MDNEIVVALKARIALLEKKQKDNEKLIVLHENAVRTFNSLFAQKNREIISLSKSIRELQNSIRSISGGDK